MHHRLRRIALLTPLALAACGGGGGGGDTGASGGSAYEACVSACDTGASCTDPSACRTDSCEGLRNGTVTTCLEEVRRYYACKAAATSECSTWGGDGAPPECVSQFESVQRCAGG